MEARRGIRIVGRDPVAQETIERHAMPYQSRHTPAAAFDFLGIRLSNDDGQASSPGTPGIW